MKKDTEPLMDAFFNAPFFLFIESSNGLTTVLDKSGNVLLENGTTKDINRLNI